MSLRRVFHDLDVILGGNRQDGIDVDRLAVKCTGMMARVRWVTARSIASASIRYVSGSQSTRTGVAPRR
jgi:hypothetical protein